MPSKSNREDKKSPGVEPVGQGGVADKTRDTTGQLHKKYEGFDEQKNSNDPRHQGDDDVDEPEIDERTNDYRDPRRAREDGE